MPAESVLFPAVAESIHDGVGMSREDVVAVAVRLFSVFLVLGVLRQLPGTIALFAVDVDRGLVALSLLLLLLGALVAVLLWFFPLSVARKLLPVMREPRSEQAMDAQVALMVGLTLIGVWVLAYALVDVAYWLTLFVRTRHPGAVYFEWSHEQVANVVATGVEVAVAIWLIFGASGIRRLIQRYRRGEG
ncbi:hypothetical protein [Pseudoxanthomonas suwonensis]|uniref:Transmembrane protein n=1 Tax=Pseudoxanthomonas suwonensis TaxID=314722 RepID=A0A0E3UNM9_9GAMM|nr:hypothetical protein [Pseudoxanthomonas suwonensis]AKC87085.1 hypothetical protein WQ53_10340 [Pseudoxanthomonas suwonensis]